MAISPKFASPPLGMIVVGLVVGPAVVLRSPTSLLVILGLLVLVLLIALPARHLWRLALILFAVLPLAWLPVPTIVRTVSPPVVVIGVLMCKLACRRRLGTPSLTPRAVLVVGLGVWLLVCVVLSNYRAVGRGWLISFVALTLVTAGAGMLDPATRRVISGCWIIVAAMLGAFAVVEVFLLHANPVYGSLFAAAKPPLVQHWSVYRATTTLGHPVTNGIFFALAAPMALGRLLTRPTLAASTSLVLILGGVLSAGSRAAFVAAFVGCAVTRIASGSTRSWRGPGIRLVVITTAVVLAAVSLAVVIQRGQSPEGTTSSAFRGSELHVAAVAVAASPIFGVGPGAASLSHKEELSTQGGAGAFESLWLEVSVGAGLPGLFLLTCLLIAGLAASLRARFPDVAGALVSYIITASAYNVFEGGRGGGHLLLGMLLAMAYSPVGSGSRRVPLSTSFHRTSEYRLQAVQAGTDGEPV